MTRILLVEDNEMNLDMLNRRLKRRGYEVITAMDGAEGVEQAKAHLPDLILMDMSLPVMDGYEATRILKGSDQTRHIPILGLSAHAMSGDADKALKAGCDGYDTKPVDLRRLLSKIQSLLQGPPTEPFPVIPRAPRPRPQEAPPSPPPSPAPRPLGVRPPTTVPIAAAGERLHKGHVLLVMGEQGAHQALGDQLQALGYTFQKADLARGEDGILQAVATTGLNALFLDHRTPGLQADRLVRRLVAQAPALPIFLVGTVDGLESAFQLIQLGARYFLPMPVSSQLLETRLKSLHS
jgi:CheY-like chemotaxis protein